MAAVVGIVGWIVWAVALIYAFTQLKSINPDRGVRWLNRITGLFVLVGVLCGLLVPAYKLVLIPWIITCIVVPVMVVKWKYPEVHDRIETYRIKAQLTGRPVRDVMYDTRSSEEIDREIDADVDAIMRGERDLDD